MAVLQCPSCELRFSSAPELDEHIESEHPELRIEDDQATDAIPRSTLRQRHLDRKDAGRG
jgi:hypothetical protein